MNLILELHDFDSGDWIACDLPIAASRRCWRSSREGARRPRSARQSNRPAAAPACRASAAPRLNPLAGARDDLGDHRAPSSPKEVLMHKPRISKPSDRWEFAVEGSGRFPIDMLRYDCCWPLTSADARQVERDAYSEPHDLRTVTLRGVAAPTSERWASFGWRVALPSVARAA